MELYQLQCFREAAHEESITKAAQTMHITQPALSKTINRLEDDLGVPLFDRRSKTIALNEYGRAVLRKSDEIFAAIDDLRQSIEDIRDGSVGQIRLGNTLPSSETSWLVQCIRAFLMENPKVTVTQRQMEPEQLKQAVLQNEVDIAVGGELLMCPELDWTELYSNPLAIVTAADGRFSQCDTISAEALRGVPILCNNSNADMESVTRKICRRAGFEPDIILSSNYSNLVGELVSLDRGVSLIPIRAFQEANETNPLQWARRIRLVPLEEDYCIMRSAAAVSRNRYVANAARRLYAQLVDEAAKNVLPV